MSKFSLGGIPFYAHGIFQKLRRRVNGDIDFYEWVKAVDLLLSMRSGKKALAVAEAANTTLYAIREHADTIRLVTKEEAFSLLKNSIASGCRLEGYALENSLTLRDLTKEEIEQFAAL